MRKRSVVRVVGLVSREEVGTPFLDVERGRLTGHSAGCNVVTVPRGVHLELVQLNLLGGCGLQFYDLYLIIDGLCMIRVE